MTASWVDVDPLIVAAQLPLHAGITVECVNGNLDRCAEQSAFDLQGFHHEDDEISQIVTTDYTVIVDWNPIMIPLRQKPGQALGGAYRDLSFSLEGKVASGTATVRAYLVTMDHPSLITVEGTLGIPDETAYTALSFSTTSFENKTGTIVPRSVSQITQVDYQIAFPVAYLILVAKGSAAGTPALTVRCPRFREVTT